MAEAPLISIVDDDATAREGTVDLVRSMKFTARAFGSAEEFLESGCVETTSCLITDVLMPGMSGLDLCGLLAATNRNLPTILVTAFPNDRSRATALRLGSTCYLTKPFADDRLLACIRSALAFGETH